MIVLIGIVLRLGEYLPNPSLWVDEAVTAYKITHIPFRELVQPQGSCALTMHAYPAGFLLVLKLLTGFFQDSEYVLRLFPFLSSIAALFLFLKLTRTVLPDKMSGVLALGLFAFNPEVIRYASEVKPYSSDVAVSIALILLFAYAARNALSKSGIARLMLCGMSVACLSFPGAIMFLGMAGGLYADGLMGRDKDRARIMLLALCAGGLGALVYYHFSLQYFYRDPRLGQFFESYFFPWRSAAGDQIRWMGKTISEFARTFLGLPAWIAGTGAVAGVIYLARTNRRHLVILGSPILLTFLLSLRQLYPFGGRTNLFLVPAVILLVSAGFRYLTQLKIFRRTYFSALVAMAVLFCPGLQASRQFAEFSGRQEIRPLMTLLRSRQTKTDALFYNVSAQYAYVYYHDRLGFPSGITPVVKIGQRIHHDDSGDYVFFEKEHQDYAGDGRFLGVSRFEKIVQYYRSSPGMFGHNTRTWILLAGVNPAMEDFITASLDRQGRKVFEMHRKGCSLYLFDLRQDRKE